MTYNMAPDEFAEYKNKYNGVKLFNVTLDNELIDDSGYPTYILVDCDDLDGEMWSFEFNKIINGNQIAYMNSKSTLV